MRRKWSTAALFVCALALGTLVVLVFPRATDQDVQAAYQWDTPLLYVWYLPLVVGALALAVFRVFADRP